MSKSEIKSVHCPTCEKPVAWREENRFRPFCSERCKVIDFGAWAGERHSIAGEPVFPEEESDPHSLQ
jgi:endogenous inhibitor of DNA gyrase (YacG/DUF329 family)